MLCVFALGSIVMVVVDVGISFWVGCLFVCPVVYYEFGDFVGALFVLLLVSDRWLGLWFAVLEIGWLGLGFDSVWLLR